jgi:hypothetical protein
MTLCSFCSKSEPIRIEITAMNLRVCPNCLAVFLPAAQFAALRRELSDSTKAAWRRKLQHLSEQPQNAAPKCLEHGTPLVLGTIPNYSFEGFVPTCCDLQHLPLSLMLEVLKISMGVSRATMGGSKGTANRKQNPIFLLTAISVASAIGLTTVFLVGNYGVPVAGIFLGSFLFAILLGKLAFYFWRKKQKPIDDGLDRLQYDFKFKDVLGEWIPEDSVVNAD